MCRRGTSSNTGKDSAPPPGGLSRGRKAGSPRESHPVQSTVTKERDAHSPARGRLRVRRWRTEKDMAASWALHRLSVRQHTPAALQRGGSPSQNAARVMPSRKCPEQANGFVVSGFGRLPSEAGRLLNDEKHEEPLSHTRFTASSVRCELPVSKAVTVP